MEFNLKKIIKALLFSTSEAVSIKDIQKVVQRYHAQAAAERQPDLLEGAGEPTIVPAAQPVQEVIQDIIDQGFSPDDVERVTRLIKINEYKRRQAPVGIRITHRAFGRDWRYPITSRFRA